MRSKTASGGKNEKSFQNFQHFEFAVCLCYFCVRVFRRKTIPDSINLVENEELHVNGIFSLESSQAEANTVLSANSKNSVASDDTSKSYTVDISVLNTIPVKSSTVTVSKRQYVVPSGDIFGIKIYADGILIVGMDDVFTANGAVNPAKDAGLKIGDLILSVDGNKVDKTNALCEILQNGKESVQMQVERDDEVFETTLHLALSANDNKRKAGLWVRDSTAGVGTMTFYDPETGVFGGLESRNLRCGHRHRSAFKEGYAVETVVSGCYKGGQGVTGELCGVFQENTLGVLYENNAAGVYGRLQTFDKTAETLPVATAKEVKTGAAQIISTVDDTGPHSYDIQIIKIYPNSEENGKNMIIEVTDSDLIQKQAVSFRV